MQKKTTKPQPPKTLSMTFEEAEKAFFSCQYTHISIFPVLALTENIIHIFSLLKIILQLLILDTRKLFDKVDFLKFNLKKFLSDRREALSLS